MSDLTNSKRTDEQIEEEEFNLAENRQHIHYASPCDIPLPGQKFDGDKTQYILIPPLAHEAHAKVLTFGARKYSADNWRKVSNAETRYLNAAFRHIHAHTKGELIDSESQIEHLAHAIASLSFALEIHLESKANA